MYLGRIFAAIMRMIAELTHRNELFQKR